jgi:hypothetical protein
MTDRRLERGSLRAVAARPVSSTGSSSLGKSRVRVPRKASSLGLDAFGSRPRRDLEKRGGAESPAFHIPEPEVRVRSRRGHPAK